jgi:hypothetical protein
MLAVGAVLDVLLAAAVVAAAPQLRVQPVDRLGLDPAKLQPADRRPDVILDLADVAGAGLPLDVEHLQPPVQQLVDRGLRPRAALLVDLVEQPGDGLLGSRFVSLWVARAGTVSRSQIFLPVSWSTPAYTFTRADPLGSQPIVPR